jgi:hypothetical protein
VLRSPRLGSLNGFLKPSSERVSDKVAFRIFTRPAYEDAHYFFRVSGFWAKSNHRSEGRYPELLQKVQQYVSGVPSAVPEVKEKCVRFLERYGSLAK